MLDYVLMAQHACQLGWFSDSEGQELIAIADEVCLLPNPGINLIADCLDYEDTNVFLLIQLRNSFGSFGNTSPAIKSPGGTFSQIMER